MRIRTRMILAIALVVVLPAVPLTILVRNLLDRSVSEPFLAEVEGALDGAVTESRARLDEEKRRFAEQLALAQWPALAAPLDAVVFSAPEESPAGLDAAGEWALQQTPSGLAIAEPTRVGDHLVVVAAHPGRPASRLVAARSLPAAMADHTERAAETLGLVRALRTDRDAAVRSYILPFVATYLLLLAAATGLGAFLARQIARPVEAEIARLARVAAWRDFARGLAHEIKNPLTPIQLAVQQLADRLPKDVEPKYAALSSECTTIVNEEIEALRKLVCEFSEFARLPEPKLVEGDLIAVLDDLARLYGDRVATESATRPLVARFDGGEIRRALVNLADNALTACAVAGRPERVVLRAAREGDVVVVEVADEGCGIPTESLERIFEPNFSTKSGSMGLGLAIVDGIVRGHGGTIQVESVAGHGAKFTIRWPV